MKSGANPEIANFHKKRTVKFAEISAGVKLNLGSIKDLTGGEDVNARQLYSSDTKTDIHCTMIFECNKKPSFDGNVDDSVIRRFVNVPCRARFTTDPRFIGLPGYTQGNSYFKTREFQEEHKCALFDFLLGYDYLDIYEPPCIREDTYTYLCENDAFTSWMDAHFELTDVKTDVVPIKTIVSMYKEQYLHAGSRAYKSHTKVKMLELIEDSLKWRGFKALYYKDGEFCAGGNRYKGGAFTNFKVIVDEDEEVDPEA
jgi:phage/plasmid-associated DNA primase